MTHARRPSAFHISVVDVAGPRSFDDLPPEIRLEVYRHLFQEKTLTIRAYDESSITDGSGTYHEVKFRRDRAIGLNIIFASKSCLADAKPALLATATFNVDLNEMTAPDCTNLERLNKLQGFSANELAQIQSLEAPPVGAEGLGNWIWTLGPMPQLRAVTLYRERCNWASCSFKEWRKRRGEIRAMSGLCVTGIVYMDVELLYFIRIASKETNKRAFLIIKSKVTFDDLEAYVYTDLLTETFWATSTDDEDVVLMPAQAWPEIFDNVRRRYHEELTTRP